MSQSQPTQELPPWMTAVPTTFTDADGQLTTSTATLTLPLTYYGPSIPLGSGWVYGGSVSPTTTSLSSTSATTSRTTTTRTTSSLTAPPTSTAASSTTRSSSNTSSSASTLTSAITSSASPPASSSSGESISASSSSSTSPSSTSSTSSSSATSATPTSRGHRLTTREIAAIGTGAAAGAVALFLLLFLSWCLYRRHRRRRFMRPASSGRTWVGVEGPLSMTFNSSGSSYVMLRDGDDAAGAGARRPGEGSPRHSGDESDPLLRASGGGGAVVDEKGMYEIKPVPAAARTGTGGTTRGSTVWAVNAAGTQQVFLRHSDGSDADAGAPGARALSLPLVPSPPLSEDERIRAFISQDRARLRAIARRATASAPPDVPDVPEGEHEDAPLLPPPPVPRAPAEPDGARALAKRSSAGMASLAPQVSRESGTSLWDANNPPRLQTARRVHLSEDFGAATASPMRVPLPLSAAHSSASSSTAHPPAHQAGATPRQSAWGGLSRLSGLAWLRGEPSPPPSPDMPPPPPPPPPAPPSPPASAAPRNWLSRTPTRQTEFAGPAPHVVRRGMPDERGALPTLTSFRSAPALSSLSSHPPAGTLSSHGTQASYTTAHSGPAPSLLAPPRARFGEPAERPLSQASATSGASGTTSAYQSAHESPVSSMASRASGRQTPADAPPPPPPPVPAAPGALAAAPSTSTATATLRAPMLSQAPSDAPPAYESPSAHTLALASPGVDPLDLPAPTPFSTFPSSAPHLPPGLAPIPKPRVWEDVASDGPRTASSGMSEPDDLLDLEPPRAGDIWRSLTEAHGRGRRATPSIPNLVHQHDPRASVHLSDASSFELPGTFPPSGAGSASSRPSRASRSGGGSSALAHQQSVSEDGRRGWPGTRTTAGELTVEGAASLTAFGVPPPDARLARHPLAPRTLAPAGPSPLSGPRRTGARDDTALASPV